MTNILVTGGTGTLGRLVTPLLRDGGDSIRVLSRRRPSEPLDAVDYVTADLSTGEGVEAALAGVDTVVHLAGSAKGDGQKAEQLVRAAVRAGTSPHIVYISVVGADRVPVSSRVDRAMFGYFEQKRAAEIVIESSGLPFTTLRASQFYELVMIVLTGITKLPVGPVPSGMRLQPVDSGEVAARLVELAHQGPSGLVDDMAGPRTYTMKELVRGYLAATHRRRLLMPVPMLGKAAAAVKAGGNLAPDRAVGKRTWEEFLADHLALS